MSFPSFHMRREIARFGEFEVDLLRQTLHFEASESSSRGSPLKSWNF